MSQDRPTTIGDARADGGERSDDERDHPGSPSSEGGAPEGGTHSAAAPGEHDHGDDSQTDADRGGGDADHGGGPDRDSARDPDRDPEADARAPGRGPTDRVALAVSLLFGVALAVGAVLLVGWLDPAFEGLLRVRPTVPGGGVAADWVAGNADPVLNVLIVLVHLADVVMGIFILVMVFVHWGAFRRLAARMRPPEGHVREDRAATDGGKRERSERDAGEPSARGSSPEDAHADADDAGGERR